MIKHWIAVVIVFTTTIAAAGTKAEKAPVDLEKLIQIESNGNRFAISRCGALGLCQIMPATWKEFAKKGERWYVPEDNKRVAVAYLNWIKRTLKKWGDKQYANEDHIMACYNGGIGRFRKKGFCVSRMPKETRDYVRKYNGLHK